MEAELTPLESAINVLEMIKTEFTLTDSMVESSRRLVKEAVRHICYFIYLFIYCLTEICEDSLWNLFCVGRGKSKWRESELVSVHK